MTRRKDQQTVVWRREKTPRVQRIQVHRHDLTRGELEEIFEAYILCEGNVEAAALRLNCKPSRIYGIFDRIRDKRAAIRHFENWILNWLRKYPKLKTICSPRGTEKPYREKWNVKDE